MEEGSFRNGTSVLGNIDVQRSNVELIRPRRHAVAENPVDVVSQMGPFLHGPSAASQGAVLAGGDPHRRLWVFLNERFHRSLVLERVAGQHDVLHLVSEIIEQLAHFSRRPLRTVHPQASAVEQNDVGADRCCHVRKSEELFECPRIPP